MLKNEGLIFKKQAVSSLVLLFLKRVVIQIILTVSNIILARLLFPQDFGIFALIIFIFGLLSVFTDLGLGAALIQRKESVDQKDLQTAFIFQFGLNLLLMLVVILIAPFIGSFYNLADTSVTLIKLYSLYLLFSPLKTISAAMLERDLNFRRLIMAEIFEAGIGSMATIILAFSGLGLSSLVFGRLIGNVLGGIGYFLSFPWKIRLHFSKPRFQQLVKFGLPFQSSVILGLFYGPLLLLYLGKAVGSENLGYYQFAAGIAVIPMAIPELVGKLIFPLVSRASHNKLVLKKIIDSATLMVAFASLPVVFVMLAGADIFIPIIYTEKWIKVIPAFYFLVIEVGIISFTTVYMQVLLALGEVRFIRKITIAWAILTWLISPILIYYFNFIGMSAAVLLISITGISLIFKLKNIINFPFVKIIWPFLVLSSAMGLISYILLRSFPQNIVTLILIIGLVSLIYLTLALVFIRKRVLDLIKVMIPLQR